MQETDTRLRAFRSAQSFCAGSIFAGQTAFYTGAFYTGLGNDAYYIGGTSPSKGNNKDTYGFNAHLCSEIYRDDISTVQPKSYTVLYIMKIKA